MVKLTQRNALRCAGCIFLLSVLLVTILAGRAAIASACPAGWCSGSCEAPYCCQLIQLQGGPACRNAGSDCCLTNFNEWLCFTAPDCLEYAIIWSVTSTVADAHCIATTECESN